MTAKLVAVALFASALVFQAAPPDTGVIAISLLERPVGVERFELRQSDQGFELTANMDVTERGSRLQLASTLATTSRFVPTRFTAKGKSYRFVNVDTDITVAGGVARVSNLGTASQVPLPQQYFTATGYSPLSGRAVLIRYWEAQRRPARISLLPAADDRAVTIEYRGTDTVRTGGGSIRLRRYSVDGIVWGRETVWLDDADRFAGIVTRVHILPLEGIREDLKQALPELLQASIRDRMADLSAWQRRAPVIAEGAYAITGATVIDGEGGAAVSDAVVVVVNGRISSIGPKATAAIPRGMRVIDARGATIIPGLWDMHGHTSQIEWAPAYLAAGVTTVRDMGAEQAFITAFRDTIANGQGLGPRLLLAGLVDGAGDGGFGATIAATPQEGRAIVDRYHAARFEQLKLYSLLQADVVSAIVARSHELGMTVTGHVPTALGITRAVEAGMDHVAHMPINGDPSSPEVKALIALLARRQTVIDPTLPWNELLGHAPETAIERFEPGFPFAPPSLAMNYRSVTNATDAATARRRVTDAERMVKALFDAGVPIVAGTDGGLPGHSLLRSLELYVEAGLTPMQALQSATRVPAVAMGLERESGTLAPGKRADFVVLNADPLRDISSIRDVRWVASAGRMMAAQDLWPLGGFRPSVVTRQ
jgi:imidazolonepropionase-like amidohydrolase